MGNFMGDSGAEMGADIGATSTFASDPKHLFACPNACSPEHLFALGGLWLALWQVYGKHFPIVFRGCFPPPSFLADRGVYGRSL